MSRLLRQSALPCAQALAEAQWIKCDIRTFDMTVLGKFGVVMADPPWEIHQVRSSFPADSKARLVLALLMGRTRPATAPYIFWACAFCGRCVTRVINMISLCRWLSCRVDCGVDLSLPPAQDLPYGTMADDEMRRLNIGALQDEGVIFLWVTGAAPRASSLALRPAFLDWNGKFLPHYAGQVFLGC